MVGIRHVFIDGRAEHLFYLTPHFVLVRTLEQFSHLFRRVMAPQRVYTRLQLLIPFLANFGGGVSFAVYPVEHARVNQLL